MTLVTPVVYTWSDDEAFLSFQGMWWSLLEEFLVVEELSSSVLLDGASNAWIWKFWKRCLARLSLSHTRILTGFSMPPFGWNTLSTVSPVILEQSKGKVKTDNQQCPVWLTEYCFCVSLCYCCEDWRLPRSASWSRLFVHSAGCWWDCLGQLLWP